MCSLQLFEWMWKYADFFNVEGIDQIDDHTIKISMWRGSRGPIDEDGGNQPENEKDLLEK